MQVRRLTAGRALAAVHWTEAEKKIIEEVRGKRNQGREKIRLMHNRSAGEKGHHRMKRYEHDGRIWCEQCGKRAEVKRITQWPTTKCKGERDEEDEGKDNCVEEGGKADEEEGGKEGKETKKKNKTEKNKTGQKAVKSQRNKKEKKTEKKTEKRKEKKTEKKKTERKREKKTERKTKKRRGERQ